MQLRFRTSTGRTLVARRRFAAAVDASHTIRYRPSKRALAGAIRARPNYSEATVQLASLHVERGELVEARKVVDTFLGAFRPNADVLFAAIGVARAAKDRMAEEK